jgi:hypothetical protein
LDLASAPSSSWRIQPGIHRRIQGFSQKARTCRKAAVHC